ncbi:hypothetical protein ACWDUO_33865, partial [Streptomyces sp. NPDC003401]
TDLFDTYLMDVATIAVTNDHRARAVLEPVNTARVYNAYKELLRAQLADAPALQALLPPDKGWRGVAANFTRLATSIAANNTGDSIQRPAPAYEARPRLPQETDDGHRTEEELDRQALPGVPLPNGARETAGVDPVSPPRPAADATATEVPAHMPQETAAAPAVPEPVLSPFKLGNFEFTNLNRTERYLDKAIRIIGLLDEHTTIKNYVGGRPVRITLHLRTTETPADVRDLGADGVQINLASYYFEKYDTGYIMGMLAHEIGLHPLASRNTDIPEQEEAYRGMPLPVPGLTDLKTPRTMNTESAGQADHIMAAYPATIRHGIYRDIVVEMAKVLARHARVGVTGAKAKDVTDLFDTYLMDLASIAVTSDYRMNAVKEPNYTARVYNAYKEMLHARLADNPSLQALLPSDKGFFGVARDFTQLATSIATNNRGDSIQQPQPQPQPQPQHQPLAPEQSGGNAGEARPRLPHTGTGTGSDTSTSTGTGTAPQAPPPAASARRSARDGRPRFVVRSGFDARRFTHQGDPVTDLTVRVALRGTHDQVTRVFDQLATGVEEFLNDPAHRLPNGDRLHVTVEQVDPADAPHLTVDLVGRDRAMDQVSWWADAAPVQLVHELTHQLGLRDEYRDADSPHRPHVLGSLLGDLDADPEDSSLAPAGLRDRHLALLGALIGDVPPAPEEAGRSWEEARNAAVPDTREAVWVDPVSLPQPADDTTDGDVPARMVQEEDLLPFGSGNFVFTNLNYERDAYRDKAIRVIQTLSSHDTIREYVGGRPVRITLHVRTTETPADVIDLDVARQDAAMRALEAAADSGDAEAARAAQAELADALADRPAAEMRGVEINLASYYFEKYDIGYVMGMLAHEIGLHPLASARDGLGRDEADNAGRPQPVPGLPASRVMNTNGAGQADHVMAASPDRMRHRIYRDVVVEMARVLAQQAADRQEGAVEQDVTDLFDTYLMDVATIAVTNDHRARAVTDPGYTARSYNAYKEQLAAHLPADGRLRALLPADKGRWGVLSDFAQLAASVGTNNRGDSIQRPTPAGEARPRLPQGQRTGEDAGPDGQDPPTALLPNGSRDGRPRFVVRSGFDARRFTHDGDPVTDLTVRVAMRGADEQNAHVFGRLGAGVEEFLNAAGHRLPNGDRLHVTVELVDPSDSPHLTVDLVGRDRAMDQNTWWVDAAPVQLVHELTHQLGLRDEYRDADSPHRPHILGSLLGDLNAAPEDSSLVAAGLRDRHLALLGALIGDVTPAPEEAGLSFAEARGAAVADTREAVWVDPVSLPQPADDDTTTGVDVPARMLQGEGPLPFGSGNFTFTNLNYDHDAYRDKAVRVIQALSSHAVIGEYVGGRPVRIVLHVRTTETPADVIDLDVARQDAAMRALEAAADSGDDVAAEAARAELADALVVRPAAEMRGVEINLASYYFEKYDIGYVMGMLAHEIGLHPLASARDGLGRDEADNRGVDQPVPGLPANRVMNTNGAGQADHVMAASPERMRHRIYRDVVVEMARVLAQQAANGDEGAAAKDVTDLFDTYLMDVATIAVTNDHRARAVLEPVNTAKVYNTYKQLLREQLADAPALQALLPSDKGVFGVARNFTQLATSIAANNVGDSIQRPAPTGEARPRLPQSTAQQSEDAQNEVPLLARPLSQGVRDSRPRFVVRSGFDARRFTHAGDPVTDLTVRVALRGMEGQKAHVREQLDLGVQEFLNAAGHRLPNGDRLHVTVELVDAADAPHLTVDLVGRDRAMDQNTWWVDAAPVQLVHELTHQLGLRDEYRDADSPHRPHVLGSLLGDLDADPEDSSLATAGLRDRHLALLSALIGDVTPAPEEAGRSWEEARSAAVPDTREAVWVDPVSLPRSAEDTTGSDVPARMPQDSDGLSAPRSFRLGNYEFTNLNQTDRYVEKAMRIVELLDEHATIRDYVGGRPVRITLRLRTTEAPADVIDRGDDGVDINLASYYFEKYDTGYLMGMLAHEIGLHPLASRNGRIAEEEDLFAGMPLTVPGLESLSEPRFMNTEGSGQADHVMAAFPQSIRHALYRDVVVEMAGVLEQRARVGVEGAKAKDVTDLFDTYLMDLASIAVTNDHRARAITDPSYTARSYNAYKAQLDAHLPADSRLRALLPADKGRWGVLRDFAQLATSVGTNNRGDSIQRPAPTDEARPRLPQETDNGHRTGEEPGRRTLPGVPAPHGTRDGRPRFVVRSGFDARRFTHDGDPVTDLTVRVAFRGTGEQGARVRERLDAGVIQFLNDPGYRMPSGDRLHVTVEYVDPVDSPHLTVDLVGRDRAMDQNTWWVDAAPVQLVHELTHQLGLRDEYRDADAPHRPHILGSLLGDLEAAPEDSFLVAAGLRDRHLALLGALIGDVSPAPEEAGRSFAEARSAAVADTREAVWVDPVSLPQPADDEVTGAGVPARMTRGEGLLPFGSGNFTFTNLNYDHDAYRNKAIRVIEALRGHAVIGEYVGGRPVRIMLHVRTTETPADVIDLDAARQRAAVQALQDAADSGDTQAAQVAQAELLDAVAERPAAEMRGVEINLASYYFEKYDTGYLMGMLAHEIGLHPLATAREELAQDEKDNRGVDQRVPGLPANRVMNTNGAGQADHVMAASPERMRHRIYRDVVVEMARVLAQ